MTRIMSETSWNGNPPSTMSSPFQVCNFFLHFASDHAKNGISEHRESTEGFTALDFRLPDVRRVGLRMSQGGRSPANFF